MIAEAALRGYVLEEILARLMRRSGYRLLAEASQDADALKDGPHGLLVRGRGSNHQADALGELLIPTPFSLPIRLFLEAKFRDNPAGIGEVRNALGVINDVNEHFASDAQRDFPLRRHHYHYALFASGGFTEDAQKYALAHQISLIDLQGPAFADMKAMAERTATELLELARQAGLLSFPLGQMRHVFRTSLGTGNLDDEYPDTTFEGAYARSAQAQSVPGGESGYRLPVEELSGIAAKLSDDLNDILILGFPQGPFVLVLQADNPKAFLEFIYDWPPGEIDVDIKYAPATEGKPGEWAIEVIPGRADLVVRFGIPPLLESWLLAEDEAELKRAAQAKRVLFSAITIFRDDDRALHLRYRKVPRQEPSAGVDGYEAEPTLRRRLASPQLSFRGRQERDDTDLRIGVDEGRAGSRTTANQDIRPADADQLAEAAGLRPDWTRDGLDELLRLLDEEQLVQLDVIRAAAQQPDGQLPRALVYELGEYEEGRTLRGFTRPVSRITRQLQRQGLVDDEVAPALEAVYEHGVQATHFAVPPDIRELLAPAKVLPSHPYGSGQKKGAIKGLDEFLNQIPGEGYRGALRHIFGTLADLPGLRIYWGMTGCSLRVARPGRGPLSVGWLFPPGIPRWMGLTDLTLGWYSDAWYKDAEGIDVSDLGQAALDSYFEALSVFGAERRPDSGAIRGWTFRPPVTTAYAAELTEIIQTVVVQLRES